MARNHLGALARRMKDEVLMTGQAQRERWRSLALSLGYGKGCWVLVLGMPVTVPDPRQIEAAREAFGVPADAIQKTNGCNEVVIRWLPDPRGA